MKFTRKKIINSLIIIIILSIIISLFFINKKTNQNSNYKWYDKMVIYHILPKAFNDTNSDGIGDFNGITEKLDYIKDLGANTIYIMPIQDSLSDPERLRSNYGYEVKDLKSINPDLGTMDDFKKLLKEAHKRDIHIVIDFVTTVISVENFIFKDILANPDTSPYKDWIITNPTPIEGPWMNFNDYPGQFTSSAWNKLPNGIYYYSLWGQSPFLQFYNPDVQEYILSVMDFWLDIGVDGFRIDATKHLFINGPGEELQFHQPQNFEFWRKMKAHMMEKYGPERTLIAETIPIPTNIPYKEDNRQTFDTMLGNTMTDEFWPYQKVSLKDYLTSDFIASTFINPIKYQINKLQDRIFYNSDHDGARISSRFINPTPAEIKLIASILLLTPVHAKIYFGDEIGLAGILNENRPDFWLHSPSHTMAWNNKKNGGFSSADKTLMPISEDYKLHNVASQRKDKNSILSYYKKLIQLKNNYAPLFFKGEMAQIPFYDNKIYTYLLNNENEYAIVVSNLSDEYKYFKLNLKKYIENNEVKQIFASDENIDVKIENGILNFEKLPSFSTIVFYFKDNNHSKFTELFNQLPDFEHNTVFYDYCDNFDDEKIHISDINKVINIHNNNSLIYIPKNQGEVTLNGYTIINNNPEVDTPENVTYHLSYKDKINTNKLKEDLILPIQSNITHLHLKQSNVKFKLLTVKSLPEYIQKKITSTTKSSSNKQLKELGVGQDENFIYIKIKNKDYIMDKNAGLDFSILINNNEYANGINELSIWKLPTINSEKPITAMINYERHVNSFYLVNNITPERPLGMDNSLSLIKFINYNKNYDDMYIVVPKSLIPGKNYNIATIVWSAGGKWGDFPPEGKFPIVERLPIDKKGTLNTITNYMKVE
ncbi:MAG: alpha-amylase family glycosyl hydrolase [Alphaproteobacteria bacterium]